MNRKRRYPTKTEALPNVTCDLGLIARLQHEIMLLRSENERLKYRMARMAEVVMREEPGRKPA